MVLALRFLLAATIVYTVLGICPDGFEHHGTRCYKALGLEASWIEAKMYCRVLGSDLVAINDASEQNIVTGILSRYHGAHIDDRYWVDGTDIVAEKDWRWMGKDGMSRPMVAGTYTDWSSGNPSNSGGQQNCLQMVYHRSTALWDDANCNEQHSFVCETS